MIYLFRCLLAFEWVNRIGWQLNDDVALQKIEKLKGSLHLLDVHDKPKNKHTVFVDSKKKGENHKRKIQKWLLSIVISRLYCVDRVSHFGPAVKIGGLVNISSHKIDNHFQTGQKERETPETVQKALEKG